ncbi:hypothetical protein EVAR_5323_1 [Eumeta japonica]|uniref:Uncharacterized protein n=1 Tax=Eumeta variegata TaxID=151549 RepID=A0A4C1TNX4_EUMVA|nr:hypothetical protein EVAR_5323_1 [Eumeta japonica]
MDNKKKPSGAFKSKQRQERKDIKQNCPKLTWPPASTGAGVGGALAAWTSVKGGRVAHWWGDEIEDREHENRIRRKASLG